MISLEEDKKEDDIIQQYKNMNLIVPSNNLLFPFDDDKYYRLEQELPELYIKTNSWFQKLQDQVDGCVAQKLENVKKEIEPYSHLLFPPSEIYRHLTQKVYVRNHMFSIKIDVKDLTTGDMLQELDLENISIHAPNTYYDKDKTPSMVMFIEDVYCCAILTKLGSVNLVGGYTTNEVKFTLIRLIDILGSALKGCGHNCKIDISSIKLCNMAVSTAIPIAKIDNYHMTQKLTKYDINYEYDPDYQDAIIINPFPLTYPSAYVRIFPSGGMFSYGFKSLVEVNVVLCIIISLCSEFFRYQTYSEKEYNEWLTKITEKWKNLEEMKMRRRKDNLKEREKAKNNKYESHSSSYIPIGPNIKVKEEEENVFM